MSKTKAQLIDELEVMRQRIAVLEASGAERGQVLKELRIKDNAIASSINAIALSDLDGKLTYVNNSFLEMWGYESRDEVLGKSAIEFWKRKNQAGTVLEAVLKKKGARGELVAASPCV
jgi:PAS domain-containing protein